MVVFVFGSNLAGRHGKGAAQVARAEYGAIYGRGTGRQGNSYAIPTKGFNLEVLPLDHIEKEVAVFLAYAAENPNESFLVTAIGTGLAGYKHEQMAPLFREAPKNCRLPGEWIAILARD